MSSIRRVIANRTLAGAAGSAVFAVMLVAGTSAVLANGLFENRPWQFQTSADRANNAFIADLIEKKKGGFFDSFGPPVNNFFNMDCGISADATGNAAATDISAHTSSPTVSPGSGHAAGATGNEALNASSGSEGPLNSKQGNKGSQSANVSDNTASVGSVDASGGATDQVMNNDQNNTGDQSAKVARSNACAVVIGSGGLRN